MSENLTKVLPTAERKKHIELEQIRLIAILIIKKTLYPGLLENMRPLRLLWFASTLCSLQIV